jgi:2-amino-4-hydroxy-6-hydroxymethyldihydropteridine diphosphokinase
MSQQQRIFTLGLGANLPFGDMKPLQTLKSAALSLEKAGISIISHSVFFETEPKPKTDQPNFINAVLRGSTRLDALQLLAVCQSIELEFGRERIVRWSARTLDIDILDFDGEIMPSEAEWRALANGDGAIDIMPDLVLPHPRLHQRAFMLVPMRELTQDWVHPVLKRTVSDLLMDISPLERATVAQFGDK